jgi:hypothetical protein
MDSTKDGLYMYAIEHTYVITYLAISRSIVLGRIRIRTIRTNNICTHDHPTSQLVEGIPVRRASHLESWHRLVQTIKHLDQQAHRGSK